MAFYQLGDARFVLPVGIGVTPRWYTVPLSVPASILRVNYMTLGMTGGDQNCTMNIYLAPLAMNMRTQLPRLILNYVILAGQRTSRIALGYDLLIYGGDYALIWVFQYAMVATVPVFGPAMAVSGEANTRLTTMTTGAFNPALPLNFDENAWVGYNNAAVFTTPNFPYGIPWTELYYNAMAAGEAVPPGEGGGGVPPPTVEYYEPCKVGVTG